jgi:SAM-dependent methyltransferase
MECPECGVLYTREQATGAALGELYDHYYDRAPFAAPPPAVRASLARLVRSFEGVRHTGRWLDVGFGEGGLLGEAEAQGWRCHGTEIAPPSLRYGERRGWVVSADAAADERFPAHGFDVVSMVELLEHVPQPDALLREAAHWLRPGGVLYITTPNAASLNRRLLGLNWSVVAPPEHLTLWTAQGLGRALGRAGFRLPQFRTEGLNPAELLARVRRQRTAWGGSTRNEAGLALNAAFSEGRFRPALKTCINRGLSILRIGDTLKVRVLRRPFSAPANGAIFAKPDSEPRRSGFTS